MAAGDIGSARVHLIVDTEDYDRAIARATNSAATFGSDAERAFDQSSGGARRAARSLLDYVANLGKTSEQLRLLRAAQRGVDHTIIDAAAAAMADYRRQTEEATAAQRDMSRAMAEAQQINQAFNQQRQQVAQQEINSLLGVGDRSGDTAYLMEQRRVVGELSRQFQQLDQDIDEAFQHNAQADRFIQQLRNMQEAAGKTHYEMLELKAAQLGISQQAMPLINNIRRQNEEMGRGTLTAKQYEWAMRGLPAQMTDITVGLATGQSPIMVLLQQGGQLKDMFGGIGPAIRAVAGAVWGLVNPVTVAATAVGGLGFAWQQVQSQQHEFQMALATTNNYVSTSVERWRELVGELDALDGVGRGGAREALSAVAGSGLIAAESFERVAATAARMSAATGQSVDDIVGKFESLGREPLNALVKLNDAEHFLTEAQYERIRALLEEGREQEAVAEATRIYADHLDQVATTSEASLPAINRWWRDIKDSIGSAWGELGEYLNLLDRVIRKHGELSPGGTARGTANTLFPALQLVPDGFFQTFLSTLNATAKQGLSDLAGPDVSGVTESTETSTALTREQIAALRDLDSQMDRTGTKAEQYERAVGNLHKTLADLTDTMLEQRGIMRDQEGNYSGAGYDALVKRLQDQYREREGRQPSGRDATQAIRDQMQMELAALQTQTRAVDIQYEQRTLSVEQYYERQRELAERELQITLQGNEAQIAALAGTRDAERQISTLRANSFRAQEQHAQRLMELGQAESNATRQREAAFRDYLRTLEASNESLDRSLNSMVARVSMGEREFEIQERINEVYRQQDDRLRDIQNAQDDLAISTEEAERRRRAAIEATERAIQRVRDGYDDLSAAEGDWANGARKAWEDWLDEVGNVAESTRDIASYALNGLTDSITDALNGSLDSFDDFFEGLHQRILRFVVEQQLSKWLQNLQGMDGQGGFWGSVGSFMGQLFGGPTANAQGGVYAGSGLSAYRNTIVSQPTVFPFARGGVPNIGLMGERSGKPHEAILPLTRTPSGDLGVRTVESQGSRAPVNLTQTFVVQGTPDRMTRDQLAAKMGRESARAMSRSGG